MKLLLILLFVFTLSLCACSQTMHLGYVWDKNAPEDKVKHYDLFILLMPDSADFWQLTDWPVDTLSNIDMDSTIHFPNLLATMAHIYSPIDSMVYEFDQPMSQNWLRGYILAADSVGNTSIMAPSINVVYIGDDVPPKMPGKNLIFKR